VLSWHDAQLLKYWPTPALSDCATAATGQTIADANKVWHTSRLRLFMVGKITSGFALD
jgi:hypothetical protein